MKLFVMQELRRSQTDLKKRQSIDANTKMTEVLKLSDEDLKAAIVKFLLQTITKMFKTNLKNRKFLQMDSLKLKNTVIEIKTQWMCSKAEGDRVKI